MESLFDKSENEAIIQRIQSLTVEHKPLWGKMNVAQMLSHCQAPLDVTTGDLQLKSNFILQIIGKIYKKKLLAAPGFKKNSPTAPDFLRINPVDFEQAKSELIAKVLKFSTFGPKVIANPKHPFFGELTNQEWDLLQWKHLNHHLNQFGV
jgi:Protein of unknown function (DUF1569)